ncbi:ATP-binding protein, partial [Kitasatospora sp. NPDC057542]|uniref:ATP-binding protein n=1 Tax=Kitasatospora sp. NPDC057542 TaxID=3346162 RepID=UPI0036A9D741
VTADERAENRRGRTPHTPPTGHGCGHARAAPAGVGCAVTAAVETPARPPAADAARALLPYEPQSAAAARRLVRTTLPGWGLEDLVEAGELIVSELVANAAKTGCRLKMTVTVERITDRCVRISVRDGSRVLPCLVDAGPAAESGRGLALVHHLTGGHWGATPEPYGKTVHADLRTRVPGSA